MDVPRGKWRLGEILVQQGWITWQQLESSLEMQRSHKKKADISLLVEQGVISKQLGQSLCLGEILIKNSWLSWQHLEEGLEIQRQTGRILGELLVEKKFITQENLYRALAQQFNKPFTKLAELSIPPEVIQIIPKHFVMEYNVMPLLKKNDTFLVAIASPQDVRAEAELRKIVSDCEIRSVIAAPEDIKKAIVRYYGA